MDEEKKKKRMQPPHSYVVIFLAMLCIAFLTYFVPLGRYELKEVTTVVNGEQTVSSVVDPDSFRYVVDEKNERVVDPAPLFGVSAFGERGVLNFLFDGLDGSKQAAGTVGLAAYMLVIGGSFGVLTRTGVMDQTVLRLMRRFENLEILLPPGLFVLFSFMGAASGFSEGAIPLAILLIPLLVAMDFDAVTGVLTTFVATQIGISCSWMSAGALSSAQSMAGVPVYSGAQLRIVLWVVLTLAGAAYTTAYARRVHGDPHRSLSHAGDARCRGRLESLRARREPFTLGGRLVLLTVLASVVWMIWGVMTEGYSLSEIASLFFGMSLVSGLLGSFFHLDGMHFRDIARAFQAGASDLVGAVLVVGMAQGMMLLLGGISPTSASVFNTLLHWTQCVFGALPGVLAAWLLYAFQFCVNLVVPSDLGQAVLTMPITAPITDQLGVSRQIAVLTFQLGGSLSHLVMPTSGCLIGVLSVARMDWGDWLRSQWKALLAVFLFASAAVVCAVCIGYK